MEMPSGFPGEWHAVAGDARPVIDTPFGALSFGLQINDRLITAGPARTYVSNNAGALRWQWNSESVEANLAICSIKPAIPKGMHVTVCRAALWRIRGDEHCVENWAIDCRLERDDARKRGSACSGQGLDAQEWSNGSVSMTLGTQDMCAMLMYRNDGGLLPERWTNEEWCRDPEMFSFVEYEPDGFVLRPPRLERNEQVQFQFVAAWANEPDGDIGPWFAVDMPPATVLEGLT